MGPENLLIAPSCKTQTCYGYEPSKWQSGIGRTLTGKAAKDEWIKFELEKDTCISGFRAMPAWKYPGGMFKNYRFESSEDGEKWTTVQEGETKPWNNLTDILKSKNYPVDPPYDEAWRDFTFPGVTAKWFRLYMVDTHGYGRCPTCYAVINQLQLVKGVCEGGPKEPSGGLFTNGFQNFFGQLPETELQKGYCTKNLVK